MLAVDVTECYPRSDPSLVLTEMALIQAARDGDSEAFAILFRKHRSRIFALARRFFAPFGADHDDLIQEATIGFFKAIRDYRGDRGEFNAFVNLCIHRHLLAFIKTATRRKNVALNRAVSLDAPIVSDSPQTLMDRLAAPEISTSVDPDNAAFLDCLWQRCTGLERGVLSMYTHGYSFEEMATELKVHYKSIDNAVWRVKVKARRLMADAPADQNK